MSAQTTILFCTLVIYIIIIHVFNKARKKYSGGKVGEVVKLILVTVVLLFIADYVRLLGPYVDPEILHVVQALFRTAALSFLAYGGSKVAG